MKFPRKLPTFFFGLFLIGLVIRFTIMDTWLPTAWIYYGTPPAVLGGFAMLAGFFFFRGGSKKVGILTLVIGCSCFFWQGLSASQNHTQHQSPKDRIRIVFWNTARGALGFEGLFDNLKDIDADIIALVEAGKDDEDYASLWQKTFPNFSLSNSFEEILLLSQETIQNENYFRPGPSSICKHLTLEIHGQRLHVFIVDICSDLSISRKKALGSLVKEIEKFQDEPIIIMGDFNTPMDSLAFESLKKNFSNAFESAGSGYASTWPVPLPVIQIDHVWINKKVHIYNCKHGWSSYSDHRPIVFEISLED